MQCLTSRSRGVGGQQQFRGGGRNGFPQKDGEPSWRHAGRGRSWTSVSGFNLFQHMLLNKEGSCGRKCVGHVASSTRPPADVSGPGVALPQAVLRAGLGYVGFCRRQEHLNWACNVTLHTSLRQLAGQRKRIMSPLLDTVAP